MVCFVYVRATIRYKFVCLHMVVEVSLCGLLCLNFVLYFVLPTTYGVEEEKKRDRKFALTTKVCRYEIGESTVTVYITTEGGVSFAEWGDE